MKVRLTFKDPNASGDSVFVGGTTLTQDERIEVVSEVTAPWLKWGECVTIEFDTEAGAARVVGAKE